MTHLRFIDLFCGIGGFRFGLEMAAHKRDISTECRFSSDIDAACQVSYAANFGEKPWGDITLRSADSIPDHDLLLAGFPCQPFSIMGQMKGFEDTRGTLFFDIARILQNKRPKAFVLENVKLLKGHNRGRTLQTIRDALSSLGYLHDYKIFNALDFGLPQKRERIWIVGFRDDTPFKWPQPGRPMQPLSALLEKDVPEKFYVSDHIRQKRLKHCKPTNEPTIWHENKSGHISSYPYSCALRAGASYNYLLVNGERRLTPREMLRLQGFPENFKIACTDSQARKQAGNSLPVNVAEAILGAVLDALYIREPNYSVPHLDDEYAKQLCLLQKQTSYQTQTAQS